MTTVRLYSYMNVMNMVYLWHNCTESFPITHVEPVVCDQETSLGLGIHSFHLWSIHTERREWSHSGSFIYYVHKKMEIFDPPSVSLSLSLWTRKHTFEGRPSLPLCTCVIIHQQQLVALWMENRHVRTQLHSVLQGSSPFFPVPSPFRSRRYPKYKIIAMPCYRFVRSRFVVRPRFAQAVLG